MAATDIYRNSPAWHSSRVNERGKPVSQRPSTAEACAIIAHGSIRLPSRSLASLRGCSLAIIMLRCFLIFLHVWTVLKAFSKRSGATMSTKKLWTSHEQRVVIYHLLYLLLYPLPSARAASKEFPSPSPKGLEMSQDMSEGWEGRRISDSRKIDPCINIITSIISHCSTAYLERYFCNFVIFVINLMKTGIRQSKYRNSSLFTLFDHSLQLSLWQ